MFVYPHALGAKRLLPCDFAVIDLETTGFEAQRHRIVEIAIVRIDEKGRELDVFETLVDPGNEEVGPTAVHGISAPMLVGAPTFAEISGTVLQKLQGAIVVAHNAQFEDSFLSAEFAHAGWPLPWLPALDTLTVSQSLTLPNHRLATVCEWAGVRIHGAHTAVGDARATARMLPSLLAATRQQSRWDVGLPRLETLMAGTGRRHLRSEVMDAESAAYR